jgi:mono/diheme cytochrome c family protein
MSMSSNSDPRLDQAAVTDASLLAAHEKLLGKQPDEQARYRLAPLIMLFTFSGLIFFAGTYLGRYSGHFHPLVFNENSLPPKPVDPNAPKEVDMIALGRANYQAVCMSCHQQNGMGLPGAFPPLAGSEWVTGSEERLVRIMLYGLQGPIKVKGTEFNGVMLPTGPGSAFNLNAQKIAAVATYVRQEWGNQAAPVSVDTVNEIRSKDGNRGPMTVADLEKLP